MQHNETVSHLALFWQCSSNLTKIQLLSRINPKLPPNDHILFPSGIYILQLFWCDVKILKVQSSLLPKCHPPHITLRMKMLYNIQLIEHEYVFPFKLFCQLTSKVEVTKPIDYISEKARYPICLCLYPHLNISIQFRQTRYIGQELFCVLSGLADAMVPNYDFSVHTLQIVYSYFHSSNEMVRRGGGHFPLQY